MPESKRLIIDMDDVMADTSQSILNLYNAEFGTSYHKDDFWGNSLWDDELKDNYLTIRHKLYEPGFFINVTVLPDAQEVIKQLHQHHEVFIVSAATEFPNSLKEKYEWIEEYFPFIHWKNLVLCGDKSIIKGDLMIDDHEKNLKVFEGQTMLFDAIHNQALRGYERVKDWRAIQKILL
jgi:5'(3')-deoxyribonucleotidase